MITALSARGTQSLDWRLFHQSARRYLSGCGRDYRLARGSGGRFCKASDLRTAERDPRRQDLAHYIGKRRIERELLDRQGLRGTAAVANPGANARAKIQRGNLAEGVGADICAMESSLVAGRQQFVGQVIGKRHIRGIQVRGLVGADLSTTAARGPEAGNVQVHDQVFKFYVDLEFGSEPTRI